VHDPCIVTTLSRAADASTTLHDVIAKDANGLDQRACRVFLVRLDAAVTSIATSLDVIQSATSETDVAGTAVLYRDGVRKLNRLMQAQGGSAGPC
jgi:hypothetical protein